MKFPKNIVLLKDYHERIDVIIKMVHPKWIVNLLMLLLFSFIILYIVGLFTFNIFEEIGPAALIICAFYLFLTYRFARIVFWHKDGEELLILTDLSFSFIRNYGIYQSKIYTITDPHYEIGFLESHSEESNRKTTFFCHVDPVSKLESLLFEPALDITYDDFIIIKSHLFKLRAPEDFLFKNDIILN